MIKINLVPQDILDAEQRKLRLLQAGVGAGFALLIVAALSAQHYYTGVQLKAHLETQKQELARLEEIVAKVEALEKQAAAVRTRLGVMEDLLKSREFYPRFMSELLETFPRGVWIDSLGVSGSQEGSLAITMAANARSVADVTEWIHTFENSKAFTGHKIGAISVDALKGVYKFSMSVNYKPVKAEEKT